MKPRYRIKGVIVFLCYSAGALIPWRWINSIAFVCLAPGCLFSLPNHYIPSLLCSLVTSNHRGFLGGLGTYTVLFLLKTLNLPFWTWNILYPGFYMVFTTLCKLTDSPPKPEVYSICFSFTLFNILIITWNLVYCLLVSFRLPLKF